jgi:hypothetical protein
MTLEMDALMRILTPILAKRLPRVKIPITICQE